MKTVTIYIKPTCGFCKKALLVLRREGVTPNILDISNNASLRNEMIAKAKGLTTVPQIFIDGNHIGGCDKLVAAQQSGKLKEMLT